MRYKKFHKKYFVYMLAGERKSASTKTFNNYFVYCIVLNITIIIFVACWFSCLFDGKNEKPPLKSFSWWKAGVAQHAVGTCIQYTIYILLY